MPECINLTFNFDKALMTPDMHQTHLKTFDDNEVLRSARAFHIEKLQIYYTKFIVGLSITYKIDGKNVTVEHLGSVATE